MDSVSGAIGPGRRRCAVELSEDKLDGGSWLFVRHSKLSTAPLFMWNIPAAQRDVHWNQGEEDELGSPNQHSSLPFPFPS